MCHRVCDSVPSSPDHPCPDHVAYPEFHMHCKGTRQHTSHLLCPSSTQATLQQSMYNLLPCLICGSVETTDECFVCKMRDLSLQLPMTSIATPGMFECLLCVTQEAHCCLSGMMAARILVNTTSTFSTCQLSTHTKSCCHETQTASCTLIAGSLQPNRGRLTSACAGVAGAS